MAKSSGQAIRDFFIQLGFDGKEVTKGFKNIEKEFGKLQKSMNAAANSRAKNTEKVAKTSTENIAKAQIRTANTVHKHQMKLMRDYQSASDKRFGANARISRLSDRTNWMLSRQGQHPRLSGTSEFADYNKQLSSVTNQAQTARTASDFRRLNQSIADLNLSYSKLIVKNRQLQKEFKASAFTAKALQDSMRNLARSYVSVFAVVGGAGMAGMVGQELNALRTSLLASTGDAESAASAFEFVKESSLSMGLNLRTATKNFSQMGVAANMAGMNAEQTREIFLGISEASVAFQMSTVDQERAMRAITQMMNKGQIYAEELKQQLGESLPAAVPIAAKAIGVTTQELFKMMEQGQLVASEFLPKFTKELRETVREGGAFAAGLDTSRVAMQRFGSSFQLNILDAFDEGLESGMADFFNRMTAMMEQMQPLASVVGKVFGALMKVSGVLILMGKQLLRPVISLFDQLIDSTTVLGDAFRTLAWLIVAPFTALEKLNDAVDESEGLFKFLGATGGAAIAYLATGLGTLVLKMVGISSGISKWITGFGLIHTLGKGLFRVFGALATMLRVHPIFAILAGVQALDSFISGDEKYQQVVRKESIQNFGETSGLPRFLADKFTELQLAPTKFANWITGSDSPTVNVGDINITGVTDPVAVGQEVKRQLTYTMEDAYKVER